MDEEHVYLWVYNFKKQELKFWDDAKFYKYIDAYDHVDPRVIYNAGTYNRVVSDKEFTPYRYGSSICIWGHKKDDILVKNLFLSEIKQYVKSHVDTLEKQKESFLKLQDYSYHYLMKDFL